MPRTTFIATPFVLVALTAVAQAGPLDGAAFFEKKVRPVLVEKCQSCHGAEKQKGGLRLDSRAAILAGGDRGPAVVPGKPAESLIVTALPHDSELKMPPKQKLPEADVATLREWVRLGAPWPEAAVAAVPNKGGERVFTAEEKAFWAFQPVRRSELPAVKRAAWVRNPIDRFVLAKLEAAGLQPAPEADRLTLLRRVTFDLTGLPPTVAEVEGFLKDETPAAYDKLVDRLLASPASGEKWGRRWLDVARYADSNGMDENLAHGNAWRYRDYVIRSFNADKPYDEFVREQVAGDLLPAADDRQRADRLTATGFLVVGPKMLAEDDPVKMRMDIIDEQLDTLGQAFMGLTLGCARCHDHKFDPITAGDYYGLAGLFYSTKSMRSYGVVASWHERPVSPKAVRDAAAAYEKTLVAARAEVTAAEKPANAAVLGFAGLAARAAPLRTKLTAMEKAKPVVEEAMGVEDDKGQSLHVHLRGNHLTLGAEAPRRLPRVLAGDSPLSLGADRSGRREFAEWLTRPDHPLTARVMVNRLWAGHFGAGLVRTPDNFGRLGERPTHPELLDWLAAEFVANGWSIKHLHRLIVTSAAYRQGTHHDQAAFLKDPENKLLWHFTRRRLDAEEVRDSLLAVSGKLDRAMGGTLLTVPNRSYVTGTGNRNYEGYTTPRRSVYLPVIRSTVYDVLQTFDFPDPSVTNGQRATTTIPTQALMLMNSQLADQSTEAFAQSLLALKVEDAARIGEGYRRALGRLPTVAEVEKVTTYLRKSEEIADPKLTTDARRLAAWRGFCRVLFASNEFVFVE